MNCWRAWQLDEAILHASKAAQLRSRDPEYHILLGGLYVKTGNVTDAITAYQQALVADPSLKEAHVRLADLFSNLGREDDAKRHYQEALRVDPSYKWAHVNLGLSLERQVWLCRMRAFLPALPLSAHAARYILFCTL